MELTNDVVIKTIGVGDGGSNVAEYMVRGCIEGVEFFAVNTDAQALRKAAVGQTVQIGSGITKGLSAGADPEIGRNMADEDRNALRTMLEGADMVFITAGMGGGISTGATPVVVKATKDLGILAVAVVTKPFNFEGKERITFAEQGTTELSKHVDSLITIPNNKLLRALDRGAPLLDAFGAAGDILKGAVQGIVELITRPGLMNADFADVRTIMSGMGYVTMGSGVANGEDRAEKVAEMAISSPLLEGIDPSGACGVLVSTTAGLDLRLDEFETVGDTTRVFVSNNMTAAIGTFPDPDMNGEPCVTVAMTGIGMGRRPGIALVASKQVQQLTMDRYQQHGMAPLTQEQEPVAKVVNDNAP